MTGRLRPLAVLAVFLVLVGCDSPSPGRQAASSSAPPSAGVDPAGADYPMHTQIVATTFWIGEIFDPAQPDGSQVCSTYDAQWAYHWSGIKAGVVPASASGCAGSYLGGCDGIRDAATTMCRTEARSAANDYFPTTGPAPRENPFYLDLPYDDLNDPAGLQQRCQVVPWAGDAGFAGRCGDTGFSYLKNRWVRIIGPTGAECYGQIEDAGPSHGGLYHDAAYVFGTSDARPVQTQFNNAGMDVSPALNGCLGFTELNGENDRVAWQFIDDVDVPGGPWRTLVTTSPVTR